MQAEAEVRHCISYHRLAEMELKSSQFTSFSSRLSALCVDGTVSALSYDPALSRKTSACTWQAAICSGSNALVCLGERRCLTHSPTPYSGENRGAQPLQGSIRWGEGGHNHLLPTPHEDVPRPAGGGLCPKMNFFCVCCTMRGGLCPLPTTQPRGMPCQPAYGWQSPHSEPAHGWPKPRPRPRLG